MSTSPSNRALNKVSKRDRHMKVEGRERRVSLDSVTETRVSELTRKLGFKYSGQTIAWLLCKAEPAIIARTGHGVPFNLSDVISNRLSRRGVKSDESEEEKNNSSEVRKVHKHENQHQFPLPSAVFDEFDEKDVKWLNQLVMA